MIKKGLPALWLSSLGLAFLLGYKLNPTPQTQATKPVNDISQTQSQTETLANIANHQQKRTLASNRTRHTISQPTPEIVTVADSLIQIKSLLGGGNFLMDMGGIAQAYLLVKAFSEQDVLDSLALLQNELDQPKNMMPLILLLNHYAELNPQLAVAFTEDNISSPQTQMAVMASVIGTWAKQDPVAAYNWYLNHKENKPNQGLFDTGSAGLMAIFNGLASHDLDDAIDKLTDISGNRNNVIMAVSGITAGFSQKEQFAHFLERTQALDNNRIQESVLSTWTMKNPLEALEWVDTVENEEDKKALQQDVMRNWMFTQPADAANWYINQADEQDKQSASEQIISRWGGNDPSAALNWLEQQANLDPTKSTKNLLEASVYQHPDFVIEHLERLPGDEDKQQLSFRIYLALEGESKQRAADFVASSRYKEALENQIKNYKEKQRQR